MRIIRASAPYTLYFDVIQMPWTRPSGPHLYSRVDWNNVSKVSCSRKQQQRQSGHTGHRTHNLSISRPMPWSFGCAASPHTIHTHTQTHLKQETVCTHACTHYTFPAFNRSFSSCKYSFLKRLADCSGTENWRIFVKWLATDVAPCSVAYFQS